jgi:dephospho-CoA kinase
VLQVALTGGIGAGKSLVAEYFAQLGAEVIDFDQLAREVVERGSEGFDEVISRFGDEVLRNGDLDRRELGRIVFSDPQAKADLEAITHPRIREAYLEFIDLQADDAIIIAQIPLLVESKNSYPFDLAITVSSTKENRMARLRTRGLKDYEIEQRMAAQASDLAREEIADIVIQNNDDLDQLLRQVENIYEDRLFPLRLKAK